MTTSQKNVVAQQLITLKCRKDIVTVDIVTI